MRRLVILEAYGQSHTIHRQLEPLSLFAERTSAIRLLPDEIAEIVWSHGKMKLSMSESMEQALSAQATRTAHSFRARHIAKILWAFAKLRTSHGLNPALLEAMNKQAIAKAHEFNPQDISNTLWALASLRCPPTRALLEAMSKQTVAKADTFQPQAVSNTLWAFATLSGPSAASDAVLGPAIAALSAQVFLHLC